MVILLLLSSYVEVFTEPETIAYVTMFGQLRDSSLFCYNRLIHQRKKQMKHFV